MKHSRQRNGTNEISTNLSLLHLTLPTENIDLLKELFKRQKKMSDRAKLHNQTVDALVQDTKLLQLGGVGDGSVRLTNNQRKSQGMVSLIRRVRARVAACWLELCMRQFAEQRLFEITLAVQISHGRLQC